MKIVSALVEDTLDFVDRITDCVARLPKDENGKESGDQQIRNGLDVQRAMEDFRRFERIMSRRP